MQMPPLINAARGRGLALVVLWTLLQGLAAGAAAFATRGLFEALHLGEDLPAELLALLAGSGTLIALARVAGATLGERIGQAYALDIRQKLFVHAAHMPASDVALRRKGYMSLRFVGDLSALRDWLAEGLPQLIAALVLMPVALWVLWRLHPEFAIAALPLIGLGLAVISLGGRALVPRHADLRRRRAQIAADMAERMPLAPELGRMGRITTEAKRLRGQGRDMIASALRQRWLSEVLKSLSDLLSALTAAALIWIGARDGVSAGTIAAGLAALGIAYMPMRDLANMWDLRACFLVAHEKCAAVLSRRQRKDRSNRRSKALGKTPGADKQRADDASTGTDTPGAVSLLLRDVTSGPLERYSLSLAPGEAAVPDHLSSSAAARLISVLRGLDAPEAGTVLINGRPIAEFDPKRIAVIDADPVVLRGSLRRAITLGLSPRPSDHDILKVAHETGLAETIARLGGLDERIAENGSNLTVVERLRLSLTRAALAVPGLLLVTAAARALDGVEARFLDRLIEEERHSSLVFTR